MKTYLRILSFAKPLGKFVPRYIFFALLSIIFSLTQLTLLKPLFDVIFEQIGPEKLAAYASKPSFTPNLNYINDLFNYYLISWKTAFGQFGALVFVCVIIIISTFLSNLFKYLSAVLLAQVRANVIRNLRTAIFDRVTMLHIGYFSNERKGDIMSRVTNDVQEVENSIVNSLKVAFREPATIVVYFIFLFFMSYKLTLFTLIMLPLSGGVISGIAKRLKKTARESQESLGRIVGMLDETLSGMRVIKAFNARKYVLGKFGEEVDNYAAVNVSMARKNELASPISEFLGIFFVAGILLYGGSLVLSGNSSMDAAGFLTYIAVFTQVLTPAKAISNAFSSIQRGLASGDRIFNIIDTVPAVRDKAGAKELKKFDHRLSFKDVSFAYGEKNVLRNINLDIDKGKTIALVGPSGGGKSTLADLVPRFYDPTEGALFIDGLPLADYKTASIRKIMGIVTQESILFNDTIFKNIAFGLPEATEEEVTRAAKIANAHEFIIKTDKGYYTEIGERGSKLSGGQRQRLSIARAVLKNPPILILDEATSALDSESEKLVQEALTNLMKNRTSLVIAHRLSTIQHADEIVVIQHGKIVERGTHTELLGQDGLYKKLNMMQSV